MLLRGEAGYRSNPKRGGRDGGGLEVETTLRSFMAQRSLAGSRADKSGCDVNEPNSPILQPAIRTGTSTFTTGRNLWSGGRITPWTLGLETLSLLVT